MIIDIDSSILENLSKTEREIVKFINKNSDLLSEMSIVDIAFETFSSPATVSRAIRKCGINGFNELRYKLTTNTKNDDLSNINEIMNKSLIEATSVLEQISLTNVLNIVKTISNSKKIYVLARGLTEYVAKEFCLKLQLLDYNAVEFFDPNIMTSITKSVKKDDLIIIFSLNGQTKELVESAKNARLLGSNIITCCCSDRSPLLEYSTYYILGYKHTHISIKEFEVTSRLPLYIISRIIIDYLVTTH